MRGRVWRCDHPALHNTVRSGFKKPTKKRKKFERNIEF